MLHCLSASIRFGAHWPSSVHQAASTGPVRERWRGQVEFSVSTFYSVYHEQDTFISIRATTARSYHHSLTDVTQDAHSTVSELSTRQTKRASKRKGTARKFTTRKHQSRPGSPAAAQGVARGPVAGRQWGAWRASASPYQPDRGAVRTCTCQRRRPSFGMDRMDVELASCAHRQALPAAGQ